MNTPEDYDGVQKSWDMFVKSANELNAEESMSIFFDDAILVPPELLQLEGKKAILEFYDKLFSLYQKAEFEHVTQSINFSKEQAIEVGNLSATWISNDGDTSTYRSRLMVHWEKDQYGDWKIKKILSNNPPAQEDK